MGAHRVRVVNRGPLPFNKIHKHNGTYKMALGRLGYPIPLCDGVGQVHKGTTAHKLW